ncbi:MAG: siderophore-interacting protein [Mesorhizobium sp.]
MNPRFPLVAKAHVVVTDAARYLPEIARHLEGHGARISMHEAATVLDFDFSRGVMQPDVGGLLLHAEAGDSSLLQEIKMELVEHVSEFTGIAPSEIVWHGDASDTGTPPNFRLMRVVDTQRITPHMQRVRLAGKNLLRFSGNGNLHCKLLIPRDGFAPEWPFLDTQGSFRWGAGAGRPIVRKYTIRSIDVESGTLDIDMVIHADGGPGSEWAKSARPGDTVGMVGPGGRGIGNAQWYLLAGDETALPAIARILESLPPQSHGVALIEVENIAEQQAIHAPAGFRIEWLHRNGAEPGTTSLLIDAVRATKMPDDPASIFVWCGCEYAAFKEIRAYMRKECGIPPSQHLIASYWRRGVSEEGKNGLNISTALLQTAAKLVRG